MAKEKAWFKIVQLPICDIEISDFIPLGHCNYISIWTFALITTATYPTKSIATYKAQPLQKLHDGKNAAELSDCGVIPVDLCKDELNITLACSLSIT